jgi:hypothetical protein
MNALEWIGAAALYALSVYVTLCAIDAYRTWGRK